MPHRRTSAPESSMRRALPPGVRPSSGATCIRGSKPTLSFLIRVPRWHTEILKARTLIESLWHRSAQGGVRWSGFTWQEGNSAGGFPAASSREIRHVLANGSSEAAPNQRGDKGRYHGTVSGRATHQLRNCAGLERSVGDLLPGAAF